MRTSAQFFITCLTAGVALSSTALPATSAIEPLGEWMVAKGIATIRIANCDGKLWGVVASEQRAGGVDRNNPDPQLRTRPTLGMPILLGMERVAPNRWEGEIYNSEDGRTYSANISLQGANVLKVEGCVLGFLCGGENWSRVNGRDQPAPATRPHTTGSGAARQPGSASADVCSKIGGVARFSH